jgi:glyoxylase-like metal-dependent hydrolase (beta-lactamase superfamily II)
MNDIRQIAPEVVRVPTGISNAYLVGSSNQWVLIDTGTQGYKDTIIEAAEDHFGPDNPPECIHLTHGHFDHAGSAGALAEYWDVPIFAHHLELPFVDGRSKYPPPDPTVGGFMSQMIRLIPNQKIDIGEFVEEMPSRNLPGLDGWERIHTPGHTPGHVSFFRPSDSTLIAGDAFCTINQDNALELMSKKPQVCRPPAYYTIDWEQAQYSVQKLARLKPRLLAAGHGEPMGGPEALRGLQRLASDINAPTRGRYVHGTVEIDEDGVVALPPPPADPVKLTATAVALGGAAVGLGVYLRRRQENRRSQWDRYAA